MLAALDGHAQRSPPTQPDVPVIVTDPPARKPDADESAEDSEKRGKTKRRGGLFGRRNK
jgi:hypothetical protein